MRSGQLLLALAAASVTSASVIDLSVHAAEAVLDTLEHWAQPSGLDAQQNPLLEINHDHLDVATGLKRKLCTLHPAGEGKFDDDGFKAAVQACGHGGIISLPDANYTIGSPLQIHLSHSLLSIKGSLSFSTNITHWVENRIPFEFQNLALGWVIRGDNYVMDGHGSGGIFGNGQVWYEWAKEEGNKHGRPMSFAIVDSVNATIQNFSVIQPQFWASVVVDSKNILYKNYYVNATQYNPAAKGHFLNWLQNTDGCDTYRSHNVTFDGMVYQGGDDCLALKPNSSMITARNISCYGGTGLALGSIGQYKDRPDWLEDILFEDIKLYPGQHVMKNGVYMKSWMGKEFGTPPNGGGGGIGWAKNMTIRNVHMEKVVRPIFLQSDLTYLDEHRFDGRNTGRFTWTNTTLSNITGTSALNRIVWLDCSKAQPCTDFTFENIDIKPGQTDDESLQYVCNNVVLDGSNGLNACHPSGSMKEGWDADAPL